MGREAVTRAEWKGEVAEVKALLETHELILRGEIKARLAFAAMRDVRVEEDELVVSIGGDVLRLQLGATEAGKWVKKITTPPPSLAEKLGLKDGAKARVSGPWQDDDELARELSGHIGEPAAIAVAVVMDDAAFERAARETLSHELPTWFVHEKGKKAGVSDAMVRQRMRAEGWIDTKTSAVSDRLTTTKYQKRKD